MIRFLPVGNPIARKKKKAAAKPAPAPPAPAKPTARKWYVLCVESGKEFRVRKDLHRRARVHDLMPALFKSAMVPTVSNVEPRPVDGKPIVVTSVKYEGYMFVNMIWCDQTADLIRDTKFSFGLLPHRPMKPLLPKNKAPSAAQQAEWDRWVNWVPQGLDTEESARLILEEQAAFKTKAPSVPKFDVGQRVMVTDANSAFKNFEGPVTTVISETRVVVQMTVLGHPVPREFEAWQIRDAKEAK